MYYKHLLPNVSLSETVSYLTKRTAILLLLFIPTYTHCAGMESVVNKCLKNASKNEAGCTLRDLWKSHSIFTFYNQAKYLN